jgi:hypothetical protein
MIKTLQISSILAVVMAGVLFVSSIVFGSHQDDEIEAFLKSPGAREQFLKAGSKAKRPKGRSSLVEKAELFAKIINPEKPPTPNIPTKLPNTGNSEIKPPEPKAPTAAKYKLYGTAVCEANPESSIALIDEMGKGMRWVRQGSEIMHTTIEQILDGKIVVRNSKGTVEMAIEEGPAPPSVSAGTPRAGMPSRTRPVVSSSRSRITSRSRTASGPTRTSIAGRKGSVPPKDIRSRITSKEKDRLAAIGDRLKKAKEARAKENVKAAAIIKKLSESTKKTTTGNKAAPNAHRSSAKPPSRSR